MEPSIDAEVRELARSLRAACDGLALATRADAPAHDVDAAETQALALLRRYKDLLGDLAGEVRERVEQDLEESVERLKDQLTRMCRL